MTPDTATRLLVVVQPGSARPVEPVSRDSSFAEQEFYPALLLVVPSGRELAHIENARLSTEQR
jgi:hypothetical protein